MRNLLPLIALLLCSVSVFGQIKNNETYAKVDNIYYVFNSTDHTAKVVYEGYNLWNSYATGAKDNKEYSGNIVIPESVSYNGETYTVTAIANYAFYGNNNLYSIHIPKTVTFIDKYATSWCKKLTTITVDPANAYYCSEDGVLFTKDMKTLIQYPEAKKDASYVIPTGVEVLGPDAFVNCSNLTSITIPEGITEIRDYVFQYCKSLTSVTLPSTLTKIAQKAFNDCTNLKEITFLSSTPPTIDKSSFNNVTNVTVNVPSGSEGQYGKLNIGGNSGTVKPVAYSIAVNVTNGAAEGAGLYSKGTEVTLRVIPNTGYKFVRWTDGNTDNPREIVVEGNATYEAVMEEGQYQVDVETDVNGTVTGKGSYKYKETATLTATPTVGYKFVRWNDGNTDNPRNVIVTKDTVFTAYFELGQYVLTVISNGNGSVTGSGTYNYNTKVSIEAVADKNYHFVAWNDGNTDATRVVAVKSDTTFTASFAIDEFAISTSVEGGGSVSGGGTYKYGTTATLTATPAEHYVFEKWRDGVTTATRSVKVEKDASFTAIFALDKHVVTATVDGNGKVLGAGSYTHGTEVTLEAVADANNHFVKWSDNVTDAVRVVTVNDNVEYTAIFAINTHTIKLNADGNGEVTGAGTYNYGATATITATPEANHHFVQWSDGNKEASRTVVVTSDVTYTATFAIDTYKVTATVEGNGTVEGAGTYEYGENVALEAVPAEHNVFVEWSDGVKSATRVVIVTGNLHYTAKFALDEHNISTSVEGGGSVSGGGEYTHGTTITLTATPAEHYVFEKWSDGVTTATRSVKVEKDASFTAIFALDMHVVTATVEGNGKVLGTGSYTHGTDVTLEAVADANNHFVKWSDNVTDAVRVVTVNDNVEYTAIFAINTHTITLNADGNGEVSGAGTYDYGTQTIITATPAANHHFVQWSDGNKEASRTVVVTSDVTYTATFAIDTYKVTATVEGNGTVEGAGTYEYGAKATLEAVPAEHSVFVEWSDGVKSATRVVTVTGNLVYTAMFALDEHTISTTFEGNGLVTGGGKYTHGTTVTLTASAAEHYVFEKWDDGVTTATRSVKVEKDASFTAIFALDKHVVTATVDGNGKVLGTGSYKHGAEVTLEAVADANNHFVKWSDNVTDAVRVVTVNDNVEYTAIFALNTHTIKLNADGNGEVTGAGTYEYATQVTITATPEANHHFVQWSDGNKEASRTVVVTSDVTYTATFAIDTYKVTAIVEGNGTVEGADTYDYGAKATLTAVPAEHSVFVEWSDGEKSATREVTVVADVTYTAIFADEQFNVSILASSELGTVEGGGTYTATYGETLTLEALPYAGAKFVQWSDGIKTAQRTVVVVGDVELVAYFEEDSRQTDIEAVADKEVTIKVVGNGVVVEGTDEYAVYDLRGMRYYHTDNLPRGIFVVVTDSVSKRVYIK